MLNIGVVHPAYGTGSVISVDKTTGIATARFDNPPGLNRGRQSGVLPTGQVRLTEHRFTVDGQTAVMKQCEECQAETPHKITESGSVCGICGRETRREVKKASRANE